MNRAHELIAELEKLTRDFWSSDMTTEVYVESVALLTGQIKNAIPAEES